MRALWLKNLKKFATGSTSGGHNSLDVNVVNSITTAAGALSQLESRFHLPASKTINKRTGAWVQLDVNSDAAANTPADVANTITALMINWNGSASVQIGKGANSGAVSVVATVGQGQTLASTGAAFVAGDKIWVRALKDTDITDTSELLVGLLG